MPPTRRVVGIDLAQHLVHSMVPVAIAVAGHALDGSHATCAQEGSVPTPLLNRWTWCAAMCMGRVCLGVTHRPHV